MGHTFEMLDLEARQKIKEHLLRAIELLDSGNVIRSKTHIEFHPETVYFDGMHEVVPSRFRTMYIELDFVDKEKT